MAASFLRKAAACCTAGKHEQTRTKHSDVACRETARLAILAKILSNAAQ